MDREIPISFFSRVITPDSLTYSEFKEQQSNLLKIAISERDLDFV